MPTLTGVAASGVASLGALSVAASGFAPVTPALETSNLSGVAASGAVGGSIGTKAILAKGTATGVSVVSGVAQSANPLATLLASRQFVMADLFTITLPDGSTHTYTNVDIPITWKGVTYDDSALQITGLRFRKTVGVGVDEQTITIRATRDMLLNGRPWLDQISAGVLDHASIRRERVYMSSFATAPTGSQVLFEGVVSTVDSVGTLECQLKVKSLLNLLNVDMPRNCWLSPCLHTLYDSGCAVSKVSHQTTGTVAAGSDIGDIMWAGATTDYMQGTLVFTTGNNAGVTRTIKNVVSGKLQLALPLPVVPAIGDTFYVYPGCDKSLSTCRARFNNAVNFRGYPYVPVPQVAV